LPQPLGSWVFPRGKSVGGQPARSFVIQHAERRTPSTMHPPFISFDRSHPETLWRSSIVDECEWPCFLIWLQGHSYTNRRRRDEITPRIFRRFPGIQSPGCDYDHHDKALGRLKHHLRSMGMTKLRSDGVALDKRSQMNSPRRRFHSRTAEMYQEGYQTSPGKAAEF
jgi:hypothetical protein